MKCPRCGGRMRVEAVGMLRYTVDPKTGRLGRARIDSECDDQPLAICQKCGNAWVAELISADEHCRLVALGALVGGASEAEEGGA